MTQQSSDLAEAAWSRLAQEPEVWYQRFIGYCLLGSERSLEQNYRIQSALSGRKARPALPREWRQVAARWQWAGRADAWDAAEVERSLEPARLRNSANRERRRRVIERLTAQTVRAIESARLDEVESDESRAMLPTLRQLLRDLLAAERAEQASNPVAPLDPQEAAPLSDDEIERVRAGLIAFHEAQAARPSQARDPAPSLLVCVGPDQSLAYDVAHLRAVRAQAGLHFERLTHCTRDDLEQALRRARGHDRPVRWLHLACHAGPDGVAFADGLADGEWLSARLQGVEVLLLAACRGDRIGDWLAVVPWVVSLHEAISHGDAGLLAHHFWLRLAEGLAPGAALDAALQRCPPLVSEHVVRHW